jgi:hypothetical protein
MGEIKSAREIAMEKIASIGDATEAEKLKWKFFPVGEGLALKYLKNGLDLKAGIASHPDKARKYVALGIESVLLAAVVLPLSEAARLSSEKALEGMQLIKSDRAAAARIIAKIKNIFNHYTEQGALQRKQTREMLKEQYEQKLKQAASRQAGGAAGMEDLGINVETLPQFQEEWRRVSSQMEEQYLSLLSEFKLELEAVK